MHEYCVYGHKREKIIFIIAAISLFVSPYISNFIQGLFNYYLNTPVTWTVGSMTVFGILYFLFNKYWWHIKTLCDLLKFPDLRGEWECTAASFNPDTGVQYSWSGIVIISQTWDKILITMQTQTSTSKSISFTSGIKYIPGIGYNLSYHYRNEPKAGEKELHNHEGSCTLTFSENIIYAKGTYFNNPKDRNTFGDMELKRR